MATHDEPVLHCPTCYSTKFNLSRPRPEDRLQMLAFRYPVRCKKCNARTFASRAYAKYLRKLGKTSPLESTEVE
ncbi:hypothetical protein [Acidipila sp. EB88]|uniref:hypothetical protein n=1 Tax=Acidipila sp. EB88 TaxID=2305226 RepID=UPI000F6008CA|nr:hypothetical protein [Acidipila sp. EB88]RRA48106.1 hypothetical protein D1Y84_07200 [Acidipila sp. EB88]